VTPAEHEQTEWEASSAWADGYVAGYMACDAALVAALALVLSDATTDDYRAAVSHHHRRQDFYRRRADADRGLIVHPAATWHGLYPGGPVDFETGRLVSQRIGAAA
jgi:hypothetical protein